MTQAVVRELDKCLGKRSPPLLQLYLGSPPLSPPNSSTPSSLTLSGNKRRCTMAARAEAAAAAASIPLPPPAAAAGAAATTTTANPPATAEAMSSVAAPTTQSITAPDHHRIDDHSTAAGCWDAASWDAAIMPATRMPAALSMPARRVFENAEEHCVAKWVPTVIRTWLRSSRCCRTPPSYPIYLEICC